MVYKIDGRNFPKPPSICTPSSQQVVVDANRTVGQGAYLYKELLGEKLKFECTWYAMTANQLRELRTMGHNKNFFTLEYYDDLTGVKKTGTFYGGDITYDVYRLNESTLLPEIYSNIKWNFIER